MNYLNTLTIVATMSLLFSCSAQKQLNRRVSGEWNIASYQENNIDKSDVSLTNIGSITFDDGGVGTRSLNYSILGEDFMEGENIRWSNTDNVVTIQSNEQEYAKSWIVIESSSGRKKWKSTDGKGNIQTIELTKNR